MRAHRHCERLVGARRPPATDLACLPRVAGALERGLAALLEPLLGAAPLVRAAAPLPLEARGLPDALPAFGLHLALVAADAPDPVLVSLDADAVLRLLDRWFGGTGEVEELATTLPLSARMLAERLMPGLAEALTAAWGTELPVELTVRRTADRLDRLGVDTDALVHCRFDVVEDGRPDWTIHVAYAAERLRRWDAALRPATPAPAAPVGELVAGTLGGVALPLRAIVDEPRLPLHRLDRLAVGDCIPLGVGGLVTLRLADRVVGEGVVGAIHGKVAVRVTTARPALALPAPAKDPA